MCLILVLPVFDSKYDSVFFWLSLPFERTAEIYCKEKKYQISRWNIHHRSGILLSRYHDILFTYICSRTTGKNDMFD